jgi:hypothetical protein
MSNQEMEQEGIVLADDNAADAPEREKLFPQWGITFSAPYVVPRKDVGQVEYANKETLQQAIWKMYKEEMQELFAESAEKESGQKDTAVPKQQKEPIMMKSIPETKQE